MSSEDWRSVSHEFGQVDEYEQTRCVSDYHSDSETEEEVWNQMTSIATTSSSEIQAQPENSEILNVCFSETQTQSQHFQVHDDTLIPVPSGEVSTPSLHFSPVSQDLLATQLAPELPVESSVVPPGQPSSPRVDAVLNFVADIVPQHPTGCISSSHLDSQEPNPRFKHAFRSDNFYCPDSDADDQDDAFPRRHDVPEPPGKLSRKLNMEKDVSEEDLQEEQRADEHEVEQIEETAFEDDDDDETFEDDDDDDETFEDDDDSVKDLQLAVWKLVECTKRIQDMFEDMIARKKRARTQPFHM
jgi:hypothetical protein